MSDLLDLITQGISFIWGLFGSLFEFITGHPVVLYSVLIPIITAVIAVVITVIRKFGIRSRSR